MMLYRMYLTAKKRDKNMTLWWIGGDGTRLSPSFTIVTKMWGTTLVPAFYPAQIRSNLEIVTVIFF
jgi:hypothetical protein